MTSSTSQQGAAPTKHIIRLTEKYLLRLANYTHWCLGEFLRPPLRAMVENSHTAEEAMWLWETHGTVVDTSDPVLLQIYAQGKQCRDWHVTEWRRGVKDKLFLPEEFFGVLGCRSAEEFKGVFGRPPGHHTLRRVKQELDCEIAAYRSILGN